MIAILVFVCCLGAFVSAAPHEVFYDIDSADVYFEEFIRTYDKHYANELEKQKRYEIFKENLEEFNRDNRDELVRVYGINQFTDLTLEEYLSKYSCLMPDDGSPCTPMNINRTLKAPPSLDWRDQQKVTVVKNQQGCGSCWAFAAIGNIESQHAMVHNELRLLSEQQLLDCCGTGNCVGGLPSSAILTAASQGGVEGSQDYPYIVAKDVCRFDPNRVQVRVQGCNRLNIQSEDELKEALANNGPIVIGVHGDSVRKYNGGVLRNCIQGPLTHAMLLVGYGTENGTPYWIVKNSYGPNWGEAGYFRFEMYKNGCSVMSSAFVIAVVP